jgi:hypothetical protein
MAELTLPFQDHPTPDDAIRGYGADIGRLHRATEEADRFIRRVLDHYLANSPDPAVRAERASELGRALPPLAPPENVLSAELLARNGDPGGDLTTAVRVAAARLAAGVVLTLQALAATRVCGRIDWPRPDLCRFTYYEESLSRTVTKTRKRKKKKGNPPHSPSGRRVLRIDTVTEVETTTDHRRWTQHEHHLADATAAATGYTRWAVPSRVLHLMESAPDWVRRHLLIVEGTRIVERSVTWESNKTSDRILDQRDVPVYAPDPALTLGEFVLAGWSEPENHAASDSVLTAPRSSAPARNTLGEVVALFGGVLTVLLAVDAVGHATSGSAWPSVVAALTTAVVTVAAFARTGVRPTTATGTITPTVESEARRRDATHER